MEDTDSILQAIGTILALLLGGFAMFRAQKSVKDEKEARKEVEKLTEKTHEVIAEEADEDHEEVTEALDGPKPSEAVSDMFNQRRNKRRG